MKKIIIFFISFLNVTIAHATNFSAYFDLRIGNIFVYDCTNNTTQYCYDYYRLRVVITDTINYSGHKYYHYSTQLNHISGGCPFTTFMFPFHVGNFNSIRLDTITGTLFYYNPGNGCSYSPNETMIDSLSSKLNDTVIIRCVPNPYYYMCIDTMNKRKYYCSRYYGTFILRREYDQGVGLIDDYYYSQAETVSIVYEEILSGRVINGIVYGDTSFTMVGINPSNSEIPKSFSLSQNYPNPFNPSTKIKFDIAPSPQGEGRPACQSGRGEAVKLIIYDILGREVATLVNEELKPGSYEYEWDGSKYASGVYFYKLETKDFSQTKKLVLIK